MANLEDPMGTRIARRIPLCFHSTSISSFALLTILAMIKLSGVLYVIFSTCLALFKVGERDILLSLFRLTLVLSFCTEALKNIGPNAPGCSKSRVISRAFVAFPGIVR